MNRAIDEFGQLKLAVLIDADNTPSMITDGMLAEIAKYGIASVKRIYGDWTTSNLKHWKERLLEHAIQPVQQFSYTSGKNATDSAMIIDAMDLLYTEKLDGFCIVSSDSDFTRLAARIREAGKLVLGFGERKTPKPFVTACDKFIYTEILRGAIDDEATQSGAITKGESKHKTLAQDLKIDKKMRQLLLDAVEDSADESGWAYLGPIGQYVAKRQPDFDPRNYGYKKLADLVRDLNIFEATERPNPNEMGKLIYVKRKI